MRRGVQMRRRRCERLSGQWLAEAVTEAQAAEGGREEAAQAATAWVQEAPPAPFSGLTIAPYPSALVQAALLSARAPPSLAEGSVCALTPMISSSASTGFPLAAATFWTSASALTFGSPSSAVSSPLAMAAGPRSHFRSWRAGTRLATPTGRVPGACQKVEVSWNRNGGRAGTASMPMHHLPCPRPPDARSTVRPPPARLGRSSRVEASTKSATAWERAPLPAGGAQSCRLVSLAR